MKKNIKLGIDAMGGDNAPIEIIEGAVRYIKSLPNDSNIKVVLVGNEDIIQSKLMNYDINLDRIDIMDAKEVITSEDQPTEAIKKKKNSSMVVGLNMLKEGSLDAFISAGNTGALVAGSTVLVGRIKGIKRPALAPVLPTLNGYTLLIDCGANVDAKPIYLKQFAQMGSVYLNNALGVNEPKVGLINIGTEEGKGNELVKETYPLLKEANINFIGNIETRELLKGEADVLVCDAFVGNVVLKLVEGLTKDIFGLLKTEFKSSTRNKIGAIIAKPALTNMKKMFDYSDQGGAPLLGLKQLVVKAHGNSTRDEIYACLKQCETFIAENIADKIENAIGKEESDIDE